jgi:hypothetical protein
MTFTIPVEFDDDPGDGTTTYNRSSFDQLIVQHIRGGAVGRSIPDGDKDSAELALLAELHNVELEFNES